MNEAMKENENTEWNKNISKRLKNLLRFFLLEHSNKYVFPLVMQDIQISWNCAMLNKWIIILIVNSIENKNFGSTQRLRIRVL